VMKSDFAAPSIHTNQLYRYVSVFLDRCLITCSARPSLSAKCIICSLNC
jgi:hypothetical protein